MSKLEIDIPDDVLVELVLAYRKLVNGVPQNYKKHTFPNGVTIEFAKSQSFEDMILFGIKYFIHPIEQPKKGKE